jgi:NCS1 family nucleobase:cation symporter-1
MRPWRLLADPSGYIFAWLVGYSGGLGAIAGVLIVDYWLVRNKRFELGDLYRPEGTYTYNSGWNWRAIIATVVGCTFAWIGLIVPSLERLYGYAWFVGFGAAGLTHYILMRSIPVPHLERERSG